MSEPRFRPEVVDMNKSTMIGKVAIYSPAALVDDFSYRHYCCFYCSFSTFGHYAKRENAHAGAPARNDSQG